MWKCTETVNTANRPQNNTEVLWCNNQTKKKDQSFIEAGHMTVKFSSDMKKLTWLNKDLFQFGEEFVSYL